MWFWVLGSLYFVYFEGIRNMMLQLSGFRLHWTLSPRKLTEEEAVGLKTYKHLSHPEPFTVKPETKGQIEGTLKPLQDQPYSHEG